MYNRKAIPAESSSPQRLALAAPLREMDAGEPLSTADAWAEESSRQAAVLARGEAAPEAGLFAEFRRKLAGGEALSRAFTRLAGALRFSGRITVSFHQGRVTKTVCEELHIRSTNMTETLP